MKPTRSRHDRANGPKLRHPLRAVHGNWTLSTDAVTAWYRLPETRWSYQSDDGRADALTTIATAWAAAAGATARQVTNFHLRVTHRPYDPQQWAADYDASVRARTQPLPGWEEHLTRSRDAMSGMAMLETCVFVGFDVAPRRLADRIAGGRGVASVKELRTITAATARLTSAVSMPGLAGVPVAQADLEWLIYRSRGLHLPDVPASASSAPLGPENMPMFEDHAQISERFGDGVLHITGLDSRRRPQETYAAILSIGRPEDQNTPGAHFPWLAHADRLPFPVEVSIHGELFTGGQAAPKVSRQLLNIRDQIQQHRDLDIPVSPALQAAEQKAIATQNALENGDPLLACRVWAPIRLAVPGASVAEVHDRILAVQQHYARNRIEIVHIRAQKGHAMEFTIGSKATSVAYRRHMPLDFWVAGVPTLSTRVGDRAGALIGYTDAGGGRRRPVMWDMHRAIQRGEQTGLTPIVGGLGAGKSWLLGLATYEAARQGVPSTVLDPSGPLYRLCYLPELRDHSQHIDLLTAPAGTLNPFAVVATPPRPHFASMAEWEAAVDEARRERKMLAANILRMLLPPGLLAESMAGLTDVVISAAVNRTKGMPGASLSTVVDYLMSPAEEEHRLHSRTVGHALADLRDMPMARLFFPASTVESPIRPDATLLVLTMAGLQLPSLTSDRSFLSHQERVAIPLMHLASHLARARIFGGRRNAPKFIALDEAHFLQASPAGRDFLHRLERVSRAWTTRALVASQVPRDFVDLANGGLTSEMFVGRIGANASRAEALRMLDIPEGSGYERELGSLSPRSPDGQSQPFREFLFFDAMGAHGAGGSVERIVVDTRHNPGLSLALDARLPMPGAPALGADYRQGVA